MLVKELQSLGLTVEVYDTEGERMAFGKEESEERVPSLGSGGLMGGGEQQPMDRKAAMREKFARGERISGGRGRRSRKASEE